ncbi:hypothetical protein Tco_0819047 [Tanacetum coccineum]|uniref:Uncharacterized protein n=1 Tax=Tanacetum coccineum TaxID=301880 RepID=A0ABQ5A6E6_9ASTR
MSKSSGVNHTTCVSRPQLKCYQVKDQVVPNNSQVKFKKKEVEDHHMISNISKKTKSVTACNDSSNSRTQNVNCVCAGMWKKCLLVLVIPRENANKSVATTYKKTVALDTTIQKSKSYHKELYENTNQEWKWWIANRCPSGYKWTQKPLRTKKIWMPKNRKEDVSTSNSPLKSLSLGFLLHLQAQVISVRTDRGKRVLEQDTPMLFKEKALKSVLHFELLKETALSKDGTDTLVEAASNGCISASSFP